MPTRIIKNISSSNGTSKIKVGAPNKVVLSQSVGYSQLLYRASHRASQYFLNVWGKFNSPSGDGIQLVAFVLKNNKELIHTNNCTFKIYGINLANWNETLLITKSGVDVTEQADGKFTTTVTQTELTSIYDMDGEASLMIEVEVFRFNKSYKLRKYLNHLGIFDTVFRLKQRVDFIEINKLDDGDSVI